MKHVVALFGEAGKGQFQTPYILHELSQLADLLGNPPEETEGLFFAIQSLLYNREIIYFRVQEEGVSHSDYFSGLAALNKFKKLHALCLPKVSDTAILQAAKTVCEKHQSFLLFSAKDLYDYLTS